MKLIVATIQDQDLELTSSSLAEKGYRFTIIGSTGGFLRQGNTTLLVGVNDDQTDAVIEVLRASSQRRMRYVPLATGTTPHGMTMHNYIEVEVGGATLFVLDVDSFEQI
ncbi:MAG: cyclic-di-AMP receptor [Anaerolineae bacterium]|nr:cyclic-di-AMP receptor [Anaerolineae bacterium]